MKFFKIKRDWLAFSNIQGTIYCHSCWLFGHKAARNMRCPWIDGFVPDVKHLKQQIRSHEESEAHKEAAKAQARYFKESDFVYF
jgi:hypothetical protein